MQTLEQDALDQLYDAVSRLRVHGCDLEYIQQCVTDAFEPQNNEKETEQ